MQALLDTDVLIWWLSQDAALPIGARRVIADMRNTVIVSAASAWEMAMKHNPGKLPGAGGLVSDFSAQMEREGLQLLSMSPEHAIRAGLLPGPYRDPFDRMLIAQAQAENMPVVGNERVFEAYGVRRIW